MEDNKAKENISNIVNTRNIYGNFKIRIKECEKEDCEFCEYLLFCKYKVD